MQLQIQQNPNPYFGLKLYKMLLHQVEINYRIHGDDGTLSFLNQIQRLHNQELSRVRRWHNHQNQVYQVRNYIDFEYVIQQILR